MMHQSLPSTVTALHLARASVLNSAELIQDAEVLLQHGRWSRAYVLGVLALEEIGKMLLCGGVAFESTTSAKAFWLDFQSHKIKLGFAKALVTLLGAEISATTLIALEGSIGEAAEEHQHKLRGLYVDMAADGTILHPGAISEAEGRKVVEDARMIVELLLPAWSDDAFDAKIEDVLTNHGERLQEVLSIMVQAVGVNPEGAVRVGRDLWMGKLPLEEDGPSEAVQSSGA